jgi:hypothetical protein
MESSKQILDLAIIFCEAVTTVVTAFIMINALIKRLPEVDRTIKRFFRFTLIPFFRGTTTFDGRKVRFCKGLKLKKEESKIIAEVIAPDIAMEEVLVLDKAALLDIISESRAFYTIRRRKD